MRLTIAILAFFCLPLFAQAAFAETVTWDHNPAEDAVTSYKVYHSTIRTAPLPWPLLATVTTNRSAGAAVVAGVRNYYYVTAVNNHGESDPSVIAFRIGSPQNLKTTK